MVAPGLIIFIFSSFFAVAFFFVTALRRYPVFGPTEDLMHLICALLSPAIPFLAIYVYQRIERKRDFSKKNILFLQPVTFAISEKGLQFINDENTFFNEWSTFSHAYDAPQFLSLVQDNVVMVLPKRDFANQEQLDEVRKILRSKCPNYSYPKGKRPKIEFLDSQNIFLQEHPESEALQAVEQSEDRTLLVEPNLERDESAYFILSYKLTAKDLIDAHWKYVALKSVMFSMILLVLFGGILMSVVARQHNMSLQDAMPRFLTYAFVSICLFAYKLGAAKKALVKAFDRDMELEVSLSDQAIQIKNQTSDLKLVWEILQEVHQTEEFYILIFGSSKYLLMIPKATLDNNFKRIYVENLLKRKFIGFNS